MIFVWIIRKGRMRQRPPGRAPACYISHASLTTIPAWRSLRPINVINNNNNNNNLFSNSRLRWNNFCLLKSCSLTVYVCDDTVRLSCWAELSRMYRNCLSTGHQVAAFSRLPSPKYRRHESGSEVTGLRWYRVKYFWQVTWSDEKAW